MELFNLFEILDLPVRTKLLIEHYTDYLKVLEGSWKDFDEKNIEKQDEQKQK